MTNSLQDYGYRFYISTTKPRPITSSINKRAYKYYHISIVDMVIYVKCDDDFWCESQFVPWERKTTTTIKNIMGV